ncbi:LOW QUALITY PROTEIN: cell growth regulator with RING finger domain protein 1-like [Polyodon spathula]|uniref:LOW QUALITY PROTEIN: cell growth regulator with RING finger domain protein 1-like n=1 Tax=Polyodon spathula TaxID=7913 RepID=UPI001B7E8B13|nr:LOW QUALITY PROTEIN: cell growth regulator with RING finger domain protein 1-like [Polyodon spathula]
MVAVFLVMLYEYSPLFYIAVVSLCFFITATMVLGWFGFDVPVILRSSDDAELILKIPEKRMVQVKNPFALEIVSGASSVTGGVRLRPRCLESCVLTCYWGCTVQGLQEALQSHQHGVRISTPQKFEEALHSDYQHHQTFLVEQGDPSERLSHLPADSGIRDFGFLPRARYPLVVLLTLAEPDVRELYEIVANVTVIHITDDKYRLTSRILYQYLLTAQGHVLDLKQLFMSADDQAGGGVLSPQRKSSSSERRRRREREEEPDLQESGSGESVWDCVVCQNAPVNRVLLPCRHTCLCDGCVERFRQCPMCRAFVLESFALSHHITTDKQELGGLTGE